MILGLFQRVWESPIPQVRQVWSGRHLNILLTDFKGRIMSNDTDKQTSGSAVAARFFWMFLGNMILMFSALFIAERKSNSFGTVDIVFWATFVILLAVRYLDIKFLGGFTVTDKPASLAHWRRYSILLSIFSVAVWALAHAVCFMRI